MREPGIDRDTLLEQLSARQALEPDVHAAKLFGLVYPSGRPDLEELIAAVNARYLFGNALNPFRFPELAGLEREVVDSVASLLGRPAGERPVGAMTSGGTESILLAMLAHRERARRRGIERPEIIVPQSAHPAYAKAAHYFDLDLVHVPLDEHWRADTGAIRKAITGRTAVVVASAFCYPYGVMDPVAEIAGAAADAGVGCHVDACIGAFVLPFLERLGHDVPPFDFRVPGVTTISADVHKYGYVPKGASLVLHRDDDWFELQGFLYDQWGAGIYGSAAIAGARPASPVACSWAVINHLGIEGYTEIVSGLMEVVSKVRSAVAEIDGIELVGDPIGPVLALQSETLDLYAVAETMEDRGWYLNKLTSPRGLHLMLSPGHAAVVDQLISDLVEAVKTADGAPTPQETARYS